MNHTPTPWFAIGSELFAECGAIGYCDDFEITKERFKDYDAPLPAKANVAHIVKCVNVHDGLVALLRDAIHNIADERNQWVIEARAALAKADVA